MKILCLCDLAIPQEKMKILEPLRQYGAELIYVDDSQMLTSKEITEVMIKAEQEGADACSANPAILPTVRDADVIVAHVSPINTEVIQAAPNLKYIAVLRSGIENVQEALCKERGIQIINAPGRSAHAVADFTVAMMLSETRNIARSHKGLMDGQWPKIFPNTFEIRDLRNSTVGVIGAGMIGQKVISRLRGFDCKIIVHDPFMSDEQILALGYTPMSLDELLKQADYVTLHLRLSDQSQHIIGARELGLMKKTAYFINSARAGLVDEAALIKALQEKAILGAALDVFEEEPLPADSPFLKLDNVTITSHLAGTSMDTFTYSVELILEQLESLFKDGIL